MSVKQISQTKLDFLVSATLTWLITATFLCLVAAAILSGMKLDIRTIAYTSSALSFISALAAGIAAMRKRKTKALITGLISGLIISVILLMVGFLIGGLESDGIISTVTFTISGAMVGSVFCPSGKGRRKMK